MPRQLLLLAACLLSLAAADAPRQVASVVQFDGSGSYVEVEDAPEFSVATTGALTISAWMRPDALTFAVTEGSG